MGNGQIRELDFGEINDYNSSMKSNAGSLSEQISEIRNVLSNIVSDKAIEGDRATRIEELSQEAQTLAQQAQEQYESFVNTLENTAERAKSIDDRARASIGNKIDELEQFKSSM